MKLLISCDSIESEWLLCRAINQLIPHDIVLEYHFIKHDELFRKDLNQFSGALIWQLDISSNQLKRLAIFFPVAVVVAESRIDAISSLVGITPIDIDTTKHTDRTARLADFLRSLASETLVG